MLIPDLPLATTPDVDSALDDSQDVQTRISGPHSINDSRVLLQSLRQSRQVWLTTAFERFSFRSRSNKDPPIIPPPHTQFFIGKFDIEIGPHIFHGTSFYDLRYTPTPVTAPPSDPSSFYKGASSQSEAGNLVQITPALLSQVGDASTKDPVLANLIQLAIAGTATFAQLKELGLLVQKHAKLPPPAQAPAASSTLSQAGSTNHPSSPYASATYPQRDPSIIFEFTENQFDKFLLPSTGKYNEVGSDVLLFTTSNLGNQPKAKEPILALAPNAMPNPPTRSAASKATEIVEPSHRILIKFRRPSPALTHLLRTRYAETTDTEISDYDETPRMYLQYHLNDSALLTQLQTLNSDKPLMKPFRPPPSTQTSGSKRKAPQTPQPQSTKANSAIAPATPPTTSVFSASGSPSKRKKANQGTPYVLRCQGCGQTGVPLVTSASKQPQPSALKCR
ncbi:hypothetical protein SISNIDRAFT_483282 [Sistotremastrum niveocremeum HHB9708]|uniref:Uncharacterized protein n=1 Tax=Sistotremastrum niveocremeum HHB9708 TaxID=1314777 RepID=A0A164XD71_9AGAM|nr:hypothetical protein SISNIDRAFT_483282 [Sistotremastrum niveocremeum HHB9708]